MVYCIYITAPVPRVWLCGRDPPEHFHGLTGFVMFTWLVLSFALVAELFHRTLSVDQITHARPP